MNDNAQAKPAELNTVFAASIAREDQWRQLSAYARAWSEARGDAKASEEMRGKCRTTLAQISRLEHCWA